MIHVWQTVPLTTHPVVLTQGNSDHPVNQVCDFWSHELVPLDRNTVVGEIRTFCWVPNN